MGMLKYDPIGTMISACNAARTHKLIVFHPSAQEGAVSRDEEAIEIDQTWLGNNSRSIPTNSPLQKPLWDALPRRAYHVTVARAILELGGWAIDAQLNGDDSVHYFAFMVQPRLQAKISRSHLKLSYDLDIHVKQDLYHVVLFTFNVAAPPR